MTRDQAVRWAGSQRRLAALVGVSQQAVQQWKTVPLLYQAYLERISGGRLRAKAFLPKRRRA